MKTTTFLAGAAIGYVLGARAGRERYGQIVEAARAAASQPAFRTALAKMRYVTGEAADAAAYEIGVTTEKVAERMNHHDDNGGGRDSSSDAGPSLLTI